ncbi:MAG: hydantoinase/carbamoylase family amidase [Betaproteobacteria bacterium]
MPLKATMTQIGGPQINSARLLEDLHALRQFGLYKTGVHRPTFSPQDIESRHWLAARFSDAGLAADIDGIGNVIGRDKAPGRKLLIGSHSETQPHAGWLDGAMGVIYGLEVARTLGHGIDVASWADEEGYFGSFLGSRSFCGLLPEAEIDGCKGRDDGTPLRIALDRAGLAGRSRALIDPGRTLGYVEAHIEQGAYLEDNNLRIGVVTAIVGSHTFRIVFEGVQNHAGTTRMAVRKDAGVALVRFASEVYDRFSQLAGPRTVWTTGKITLDPGAPSIVPGGADMVFQFRDTDPARLARLTEELESLVAQANRGPCRVAIAAQARTVPQSMDNSLQNAIEQAAERRVPGLHARMPSGAGHDAQVLAERVPSGMLFVPSIGGVSHHWSEDTQVDDIVLGCQVLADAAAEILALD